jgi:hypothetical protein
MIDMSRMSTLTGKSRHVVLDGLRDLPGEKLETQDPVGTNSTDLESGTGIMAASWQVKYTPVSRRKPLGTYPGLCTVVGGPDTTD